MSEYVSYRGKLKYIDLSLEDCNCYEEFAMQYFNENNYVYDDFYPTVLEQLYMDFSDEFYYNKQSNQLYYIEYEKYDREDSFINLKEVGEGEFEFETLFYNGSCGIEEMLDEGFAEYHKENYDKKMNIPQNKNSITKIGIHGSFKCYLNMTEYDAIKRYAIEIGDTIEGVKENYCIETIDFDDEFSTYDVDVYDVY